MKHLLLVLLLMWFSNQTLADLNSEQNIRAVHSNPSKPQKIEHTTSPDPNDCTDSASNYCKSENRRAQLAADDDKLNTEYKNVLMAITKYTDGESRKKLLLDSQRSWITFRDKTCKFVGALGDFGEINCLITLTEERTKQLLEYHACLEGDECNYSP